MMKMMKELSKGLKPGDLDFDPPLHAGMEPVKKILRTDESRFAGIADYPFAPHYCESRSHGTIRIHYVDEGPRDARETVILMHGEPSWSYLYRKMIPPLAAKGYRVLAPDLVGFGKSDKPSHRDDYSYERHVQWMSDWLVAAEVNGATLFCQDWGSLIGLRVLAKFPERFDRLVLANGGLPTGGGQANYTFKMWASVVSQKVPNWGPIMRGGVARKLTDAEVAAYLAPFPSEEYMAGSRQFPRLVPQFDAHASVEENKGAWRRVFDRWEKPMLTLFSDQDAVSKGGHVPWQKRVPGAKGRTHPIMKGGHFLQEDCPEELVRQIIGFIDGNPAPPKAPPASARL